MRIRIGTLGIAGMALVGALAAGPALAQGGPGPDRMDWGGGRPDAPMVRLAGPGVPLLLPELRDNRRGRAFVARNFDANGNGWIDPREARAANRAFIQIAGIDRARFDWESRDHIGPPAPSSPRWDRAAMRDYRFRQTPAGATMTMQEDVLFRTDSAELRPGAIDRLRPLAAYLRDNAGIRVAIAGHTDSRGSDAHNKDLSERRAESVRVAFDEMGVTRARFRVTGYGESQPVATNATPAGQRLNRRVEVTLLGQRADRFLG